MSSTRSFAINRAMSLVGLTLALVAVAGVAGAQDREDRWEFTLGVNYQLGTSIDAAQANSVETDDDFGFITTVGYNFSEMLETSFAFQYAGIGYDAEVLNDDGDLIGISGDYDSWALSANAILNLMEGPFTPYIGAGIGWTWIDTNIPSGLPDTVCWWDPWWGYVCYTDYPTKTTDAFSYQALLGIRYAFNDTTFMRFGYTSQWMDFENAQGTPRFDVFGVEIGWVF